MLLEIASGITSVLCAECLTHRLRKDISKNQSSHGQRNVQAVRSERPMKLTRIAAEARAAADSAVPSILRDRARLDAPKLERIVSLLTKT